MGHRNPQGLYYDQLSEVIINTEHGPLGGDEININKLKEADKIANFGWAISSYGVHYGRVTLEESPLHKSHVDYGFIEPIKYFNPAVGISQLIMDHNKDKNHKNYVITSLGHKLMKEVMSIHFFQFDQNIAM